MHCRLVCPLAFGLILLAGAAPAGLSAEDAPSTTTANVGGPREVLRLLGVDDSHFDKFVDGQSLGPDEDEVLGRILYAIGRVQPVLAEHWAKGRAGADRAELLRAPAEHRGQCFPLKGQATRVTLERPLPELAQRLGLDKFYRCECLLVDDQPAVVYALRVPESWPRGQAMKERVSFSGLFLKLADGGERPHTPAFVARRVAWHPATLAGDQGIDFGLFDGVVHNLKLDSPEGEDHDAFYQLLAAMDRVPAAELTESAESALKQIEAASPAKKHNQSRPSNMPSQFPAARIFMQAQEEVQRRRELRDVMQLSDLVQHLAALSLERRLADEPRRQAELDQEWKEATADFHDKAARLAMPAEISADPLRAEPWLAARSGEIRAKLAQLQQTSLSQGHAMVFEGVARRAVKVHVSEPLVRERFGIDHYYQVTVFVDLGGPFKLDDSEQLFTDLPIQFCLRSWPERMPMGDDISEHVRISGVFFKIWPYASQHSREVGPQARHWSPLLIGHEPIWYPRQEGQTASFPWYLGGLLIVALGVAVILIWRGGRKERESRRLAIHRALDTGGTVGPNDPK